MKRFIKRLFFLLTPIIIFFIAYIFLSPKKLPETLPCTLGSVEIRTLYHKIPCAGTVALKKVYKVGSLVAGTVKKVHKEENQKVAAGDLIAEIDLGKGDADYRFAYHCARAAKKEYCYLKQHHARSKALYQAGQLSRDNFERITKEYEISYEHYLSKKALLDKSSYELENCFIKAPCDGTIITLSISEGSSVLNDFQNVLCEIAPNEHDLEIRLDIDESDCGHIKQNQSVVLTANAFPHHRFKGTITALSVTPKRQALSLSNREDEAGYYKAIVSFEKAPVPLKAGMTVHGLIAIDKRKECQSVSGLAFHLDKALIKRLALCTQREYIPLSEQEKKVLHKQASTQIIQYLWLVTQKSIAEKAVFVGMTDNSFWELLSPLDQDVSYIIAIDEKSLHRYEHAAQKKTWW